MSTAVFPVFAGLKLNAKRTRIDATKIGTSSSGKETRAVLQSTPRYRYVVELEFVRTYANGNEVDTLMNFIAARQGAYDTFFLPDPYTGANVLVRFENDEQTIEQLYSGIWSVKSLNLISVK